MTDDASVLLVGTGHETWYVDKSDDGNIERITGAHKACRLLTRFDVEHTCENLRLVRDNTYGVAIDARKPARDLLRVGRVNFHVVTAIHHGGDDFLHVVGLIGRRRKNITQIQTKTIGVVASKDSRWLLHIV